MTFVKHGDLQPINSIDASDVDNDSTRLSFDKLKKDIDNKDINNDDVEKLTLTKITKE